MKITTKDVSFCSEYYFFGLKKVSTIERPALPVVGQLDHPDAEGLENMVQGYLAHKKPRPPRTLQ